MFGAFALAISVFKLDANAITATGTASATVVRQSFSVSCNALSFGSIDHVNSASVVTVAPGGARSLTGNLRMGSAAYQPSTCYVTGPVNTHYTARAPSVLTFTAQTTHELPGKQTSLRVSDIRMVSSTLNATSHHIHHGKSDAAGKDVIRIGASLYVPKDAAPGIYTGMIPVTIHY